jgi:hypothetical protein
MGSASLYVYYRVRTAELAHARALIRQLLDRIDSRFGVRGRVLTRCDEPELWMEIYDPVVDPVGFQAALEEICAQIEFAAVLAPDQIRHCECFVESVPCA